MSDQLSAMATAFQDMDAQKQYIDVWLKYLDQDEITCTKDIGEKRKELEEYEKLKGQIGDLTKKLEKTVHIPIGRMAFLPGTLDHTNEFYALIGDNHFVRKSSFRTVELLERRQTVIRDQLKKLEEQMNLVKQRKEFASELMKASTSEEVEIREPYNEKQARQKREPTMKVPKEEYEALMRRLDEMEAFDELSDADEDEEVGKDDEIVEDDEESLDSDDGDINEVTISAKTLDRLIKEQKPELADIIAKDSKKGVRFNDRPLGSAQSSPLIQEIPEDRSSPPSILKHTDHIPRVDRQAVEAMNRRDKTVFLPASTSALKETIVERDPLAVLDKPTTSNVQPENKESKFKAHRKQ